MNGLQQAGRNTPGKQVKRKMGCSAKDQSRMNSYSSGPVSVVVGSFPSQLDGNHNKVQKYIESVYITHCFTPWCAGRREGGGAAYPRRTNGSGGLALWLA